MEKSYPSCCERALTRERVVAGLVAAKRRGRKGERPPALDPERVEPVVTALEGRASKVSVCSRDGVDTLRRHRYGKVGVSTNTQGCIHGTG